MQTRQGRTLEALSAAQMFIDTNTDRIPGIGDTGARHRLNAIVTNLREQAAHQVGGALAARMATRKLAHLRTILIEDHIAPIVRVARMNLPGGPARRSFRMPRGTPPVPLLAAAAHGMAQSVEPFAELFISTGLPGDFLAELTMVADELVACLIERDQYVAAVHASTLAIARSLVAGRQVVAVLDTFVRRATRDDEPLKANWDSSQRVRRLPRRRRELSPANEVPLIASATLRLLPDAIEHDHDEAATLSAPPVTRLLTESASATCVTSTDGVT